MMSILSSDYAVVELRMTFYVKKSAGPLTVGSHAAITDALDKAVELKLPDGFILHGTKLEIGDL